MKEDEDKSWLAMWLESRGTLFLMWSGGGTSFRDSVRLRTGGSDIDCARCCGKGLIAWPKACVSSATTAVTGEDGTGGNMEIDGCRRLPLGAARKEVLDVERTAIPGGEGSLNEVFHTGAEGGGTDAMGRAATGIREWHC